MTRTYRVRDVFVAGGQPALTYVSREHLKLEERIESYLDELHRVLSVSGPTKSGKTVLVRKLMPRGQALWVSGGQIESADDIWVIINEELGNHQSYFEKASEGSSHTGTVEADAAVRPGGVGGGIKTTSGDASNQLKEKAKTWTTDPKRAAIRSMLESKTPWL